jgi:hypothetical protein
VLHIDISDCTLVDSCSSAPVFPAHRLAG